MCDGLIAYHAVWLEHVRPHRKQQEERGFSCPETEARCVCSGGQSVSCAAEGLRAAVSKVPRRTRIFFGRDWQGDRIGFDE